jgi:hypothetical protein
MQTPRPHFAVKNSHGHTKKYLRKIIDILRTCWFEIQVSYTCNREW